MSFHGSHTVPPHNLYGDHGPRCFWCSGLGAVLTMGREGAPTRYTSRCRCHGTGVDLEVVRDTKLATLEREGVQKFGESFDQLMQALGAKHKTLAAA